MALTVTGFLVHALAGSLTCTGTVKVGSAPRVTLSSTAGTTPAPGCTALTMLRVTRSCRCGKAMPATRGIGAFELDDVPRLTATGLTIVASAVLMMAEQASAGRCCSRGGSWRWHRSRIAVARKVVRLGRSRDVFTAVRIRRGFPFPPADGNVQTVGAGFTGIEIGGRGEAAFAALDHCLHRVRLSGISSWAWKLVAFPSRLRVDERSDRAIVVAARCRGDDIDGREIDHGIGAGRHRSRITHDRQETAIALTVEAMEIATGAEGDAAFHVGGGAAVPAADPAQETGLLGQRDGLGRLPQVTCC